MILPNEHKHRDTIEVVDQSQIEKQKKLIGSIQLQRGHRRFEVNTKTQEISEVIYDYKEYVVGADRTTSKKKSLTIKDDCIYVGPLNKKNVIKRLNRNR